MKAKIAITLTSIAVGLYFLITSSSSQASQKHYKLNEFKKELSQNPQTLEQRYITVYGVVKEGSIQRQGLEADFTIEEGTEQLAIHFNGKTLLPDTFKPGAQTAIDGIYDIKNKVFIADKVMAKCASRYESSEYQIKTSKVYQDKL